MTKPVQGELELGREGAGSREALETFLNDGTDDRVRLIVNRNRVTMASVVFGRGVDSTVVRLHEAYLEAPHAVQAALRSFLRTKRRAKWRIVAAYGKKIETDAIVPRRRGRPRSAGNVYHLQPLLREVNARFFGGRVKCDVRWGRGFAGCRSGRGRSIRYGSWDASTRTVRVNPILDDRRVPEEFVRYILYHEMLHAVVPRLIENGRQRHHTAQFRALEKAFPDFESMKRLSRELLDRLL